LLSHGRLLSRGHDYPKHLEFMGTESSLSSHHLTWLSITPCSIMGHIALQLLASADYKLWAMWPCSGCQHLPIRLDDSCIIHTRRFRTDSVAPKSENRS
jgi:hypothetical protein